MRTVREAAPPERLAAKTIVRSRLPPPARPSLTLVSYHLLPVRRAASAVGLRGRVAVNNHASRLFLAWCSRRLRRRKPPVRRRKSVRARRDLAAAVARPCRRSERWRRGPGELSSGCRGASHGSASTSERVVARVLAEWRRRVRIPTSGCPRRCSRRGRASGFPRRHATKWSRGHRGGPAEPAGWSRPPRAGAIEVAPRPGVLSRSSFDVVEANFKVADSQYNDSRGGQQTAGGAPSAALRLALAEQQLLDTSLVAPFAGASRRPRNAGEYWLRGRRAERSEISPIRLRSRSRARRPPRKDRPARRVRSEGDTASGRKGRRVSPPRGGEPFARRRAEIPNPRARSARRLREGGDRQRAGGRRSSSRGVVVVFAGSRRSSREGRQGARAPVVTGRRRATS